MNEDVRALKAALENVKEGIKSRFRKRKSTKEHIKKDSVRYFVEKFSKLWTKA